jgi:hypothetical protein
MIYIRDDGGPYYDPVLSEKMNGKGKRKRKMRNKQRYYYSVKVDEWRSVIRMLAMG